MPPESWDLWLNPCYSDAAKLLVVESHFAFPHSLAV